MYVLSTIVFVLQMYPPNANQNFLYADSSVYDDDDDNDDDHYRINNKTLVQ